MKPIPFECHLCLYHWYAAYLDGNGYAATAITAKIASIEE